MTDPNQTNGDLIAHIHGDSKPSQKDALAASAELTALEELDALLQNRYGGSALPDPQDMVDVVMGQATPTQRLIVAAYVRDSIRGKGELAALEKELAAEAVLDQRLADQKPGLKQSLAIFIATPLSISIGLRASADEMEQQTFQVAELQAQLTVRIVPPIREVWEIEGYLTQNYLPVAAAQITLQPDSLDSQLDSQTGESDSEGFFAFRGLSADRYNLSVHLAEGVMTIPELNLTDEDG